MQLKTHLNKDEITNLCNNINMPNEAIKQIIIKLKSFDFEKIQPYAFKLLNIKTAHKAYESINEIIKADGYTWLTISMVMALFCQDEYRQEGISDSIFYDTMACFTRFVIEHKESYGKYGFDRAFWTYRQLSKRIYRIGTLEFEMLAHQNDDIALDGKIIVKKGEEYLSIHIPSDAKINKQDTEKSYSNAVTFFAKYHPEFKYSYFYCNTWLLSPNLKKVLKKESNIVQFQNDYTITNFFEDNQSYKLWVFKDENLKTNDLPENTSLQRNLKNLLLQGGKVGAAEGVIPKEKYIN